MNSQRSSPSQHEAIVETVTHNYVMGQTRAETLHELIYVSLDDMSEQGEVNLNYLSPEGERTQNNILKQVGITPDEITQTEDIGPQNQEANNKLNKTGVNVLPTHTDTGAFSRENNALNILATISSCYDKLEASSSDKSASDEFDPSRINNNVKVDLDNEASRSNRVDMVAQVKVQGLDINSNITDHCQTSVSSVFELLDESTHKNFNANMDPKLKQYGELVSPKKLATVLSSLRCSDTVSNMNNAKKTATHGSSTENSRTVVTSNLINGTGITPERHGTGKVDAKNSHIQNTGTKTDSVLTETVNDVSTELEENSFYNTRYRARRLSQSPRSILKSPKSGRKWKLKMNLILILKYSKLSEICHRFLTKFSDIIQILQT